MIIDRDFRLFMDAVRETIRKLYSRLEADLDVNAMIGELRSRKLIGKYKKEEITSESNCVKRNRVLLDHLERFDESNLRIFCDVLSRCCPPSGSTQAQLIIETLDKELGTVFWCICCTLSSH